MNFFGRKKTPDPIAQAKAVLKRRRKAERLETMPFHPVTPTNHPGAVLARGERRRLERSERATTFDHGSASAAKLRNKAAKKDKPRRRKVVATRKSVLPEIDHEIYDTRSKRRQFLREWSLARASEQRPVEHLHPRHLRARAA